MNALQQLGMSAVESGACSGPGRWHAAEEAGVLEIRNPASGALLGRVHCAGEEDYDTVLQSATAAAAAWRAVPAPRRGELVRQIGEALRLHKAALGELVSLEVGKIRAEGEGEVQEMIDMADFAVGQSRMLYGLSMHSERPGHSMREQWHPLGVVGVMSAFNFPVAVWSWNAFLSAICGNATVWKPSPKAPLTAIAVQKICNAVLERNGAPPVFQLLIDGPRNVLSKKLVEDPAVALLSFTGSSRVGREVAGRVATRFGRCLLELSGNNALAVDASADLALALPSIVFGAVGTAGQRCTTTRRLLVHRSRESELLEALRNAYASVPIGDPLAPGTLMGPLIDSAAVEAFESVVSGAQAEGAELVCGGHRLPGPGHFVQPTILRARNDMACVQHETFAPILYVIPFDTLEEAIAMNNDSRFGLSSALFTRELRAAERWMSAGGSDCGIANVNIGTSGAEIGGAFGGEKETGGGREAGSDAWKSYMRRQTNTVFYGEQAVLAQGIRFELPG
ncbi:MAG: aldehyde dehydrogenase family protein [Gammaproteobacteria bacterium]